MSEIMHRSLYPITKFISVRGCAHAVDEKNALAIFVTKCHEDFRSPITATLLAKRCQFSETHAHTNET